MGLQTIPGIERSRLLILPNSDIFHKEPSLPEFNNRRVPSQIKRQLRHTCRRRSNRINSLQKGRSRFYKKCQKTTAIPHHLLEPDPVLRYFGIWYKADPEATLPCNTLFTSSRNSQKNRTTEDMALRPGTDQTNG